MGYLRKTRLAALLCALLVTFATSALADDVTIVFGPVSTDTNPVVNGVFVGPYAATINGSAAQIVCDDYDHDVSNGEVWQASVSTFADLSHTRFWDSSNPTQSLKNYEMAAWLTAQMFTNPKSAWGDIGYAIWRIFSGDAPNVGNSSSWLALAAKQDFSHYDFSQFRIYTPSNPTSPQEYIVMMPEPESLLLLGLGLFSLLLFRKRQPLATRT